MKLLKRVLTFLVVIAVIFTVQTITFFKIGQKQIINKLLPQEFRGTEFYSDSAFVYEYYGDGFCRTGLLHTTYLNLELKKQESKLKSKLGVKYIRIGENFNDFNQLSDSTLSKFEMTYAVSATTGYYGNLYDFYECSIIENFFVKNINPKFRQTTYRWFLFFWIQTKVGK
jgi:hypothetical protein